ncbi:MAG: peptidase T [Oscillibacter sp.]|nr:peptidase T [Oscillibacter sp.]MDY5018288.1 peptidase T [Oscillospiraceae bacterium]
MESAKSRFLRYVTYYTTSDDFTGTSPSTERQKDLGNVLMQELEALHLEDVHMDDCGNVLATLPASEGVDAPVIALIAHMDTAPDASGENVKPRLVRYEGGELKLNDSVSLTEALCPGLESHVGNELIVTDGTTLLGADDKAGLAEIMAAVETILEKNIKHGEVRIIFTTDEEIGHGTDGLDVQELGCDYGYTVDGGPLGEIEYENFNAAAAVLTVHGVGVHPGSAKNVMVNAATVAMDFHALLPEDEVPEKTEGYEGFFHLTDMEGGMAKATLRYIIRDHDREKFEEKKALFAACAEKINEVYGDGTAEVDITDSYYNMKEKILPHFHLIERAENAFRANGVAPMCVPIRGGTDGANLSWAGLPCPNLSTGGYNYHGVREWIPSASLDIMTNVVVTLTASFAE